MSSKTTQFKFKGSDIVFTDYSGLINADEIIAVINEAQSFIEKNQMKDVLYLINIEKSSGSVPVINRYKDFAKIIKPLIKKDAVIGASGLHKILISGIKSFSGISMELFNSKEEACNYLVSDN